MAEVGYITGEQARATTIELVPRSDNA